MAGPRFASSLNLATDLSRPKMREAMSAIMVFFARRFRGPAAGYVQARSARLHDEHGTFLSHLIFLVLQPWHEREAQWLVWKPAAPEVASCSDSDPSPEPGDDFDQLGSGPDPMLMWGWGSLCEVQYQLLNCCKSESMKRSKDVRYFADSDCSGKKC